MRSCFLTRRVAQADSMTLWWHATQPFAPTCIAAQVVCVHVSEWAVVRTLCTIGAIHELARSSETLSGRRNALQDMHHSGRPLHLINARLQLPFCRSPTVCFRFERSCRADALLRRIGVDFTADPTCRPFASETPDELRHHCARCFMFPTLQPCACVASHSTMRQT